MYLLGRLSLIITAVLLTGCSALSDMHRYSTACDYDQAWEAALDTVKDRSVSTQEKDAGLIVTEWLEIPMPGRAYGVFRRDLGESSKDRSRVTLRVVRVDDATQIGFLEDRQRWTFRGGSRLFGWASANPSPEVLYDIRQRLGLKLKEYGCSLSLQ